MTRARDTANTQENIGGSVAPFVAGKNAIINGDFFVNQRTFSTTTTSGTYGLDRFKYFYTGGTSTYSVQQFTPGAAPVAGYEAVQYARLVTSGQSAAGDYTFLTQVAENPRLFAGQTVTFSFWAKAASGTPKVSFEFTQYFGTGGSPSATVNTYGGQATLSTSWARYSMTFAVPSISGKTFGTTANTAFTQMVMWVSAGSSFDSRTGTIGIQSNTFDIWGWQLEAGSVATPFTTATGTVQGELAACQRYYYRTSPNASGVPVTNNGGCVTTTIGQVYTKFPVSMRVNPASMEYSAIDWYNYGNNTTYNSGTYTLTAATPDFASVRYTHGSAIFTAGQVGAFVSNGSSGYLGFTAEL